MANSRDHMLDEEMTLGDVGDHFPISAIVLGLKMCHREPRCLNVVVCILILTSCH